MKKRAVISAVASIALAGVLAVGFAACKESAKDIKGEQVDKAAWDTAMDFSKYDNYKVEYVNEGEGKIAVDGKEATIKNTTTITIVVEGDKQYIKQVETMKVEGDVPEDEKEYYKDKDETTEYYISGTDIIAQKDGKWTKITDPTELRKYSTNAGMIKWILPSTDYDKYEYKEDQKGYAYKEASEGSVKVVKIVDGKFKAYYEEDKIDGSGMTGTSTESILVTHGDQKVEVPAV